MEVKKNKDGENTIVSISGEIDSTNSNEFEEQIKEAIQGEPRVILDLADLEYVSSAGLRVFLMLQKLFGRGDALTIKNVNNEVMGIFKVTGFLKLLNIQNEDKG